MIGVRGCGQTIHTNNGGNVDLTRTGAEVSGAAAFSAAGVKPADIKYASVYDNFTIMVLMQLEGLGFCGIGEGGKFVADGNLISGVGKLPWNTDGGGLCNNHPMNRGGITKAIEAVRQLRGEAHPAVQVKDCNLALASGPGLVVGGGHNHATVILSGSKTEMTDNVENGDAPTEKRPMASAYPETAEFWQAANQGRLVLKGCNSCGNAHWYPRAVSTLRQYRSAWADASGRGKIYAFSPPEGHLRCIRSPM